MVGNFEALYLCSKSVQGKDGNMFHSVTLMQGDDVRTISCTPIVIEHLKGYEMKQVKLQIELTSFGTNKSYRVIGIGK